MLTDAEIDALAADHVRSGAEGLVPGHTVVPRRIFALEHPAGVYFGTQIIPDLRHDASLVGSGGFFVYRETGAVRAFGSGEVVGEALRRGALDPVTKAVTPAWIQSLLKLGEAGVLVSSGVTTPPQSAKLSWWRFWR